MLLDNFSKYLTTTTDTKFKIQMIQNLDLVINVEESLFNLRSSLKDSENEVFNMLFSVWCCEPISCISLCLLSER